jgi:hypothetical protein
MFVRDRNIVENDARFEGKFGDNDKRLVGYEASIWVFGL